MTAQSKDSKTPVHSALRGQKKGAASKIVEFGENFSLPVLQDTVVTVPPYPFTFVISPPRPSHPLLWLLANTCWGESSSSPCFWTGTRHLLSPTSTISTNWPNFHMAAQIQPTQQAGRGAQQAGRGAMCTR